MNLGSALKKSYTKAQRSVTKAIDAPPTVVLPNVDPSLLDSADEFGSMPVSLTNDAQLEQIMGRRKSLIDQRAGLTPPGAVEPKTDTRSLWIAGGLGLLGALLNKGNNGTRQSGMRAMQNVLGGAQNTANRKAQMAAQKSMQDYNAALTKNQAELEKAMLDAATVNGRISSDNAAALTRNKQANDDREYNLKLAIAEENARKNQANEAIARYKATPEFARTFDELRQRFPNMSLPQIEAMALAPLQLGMEKVFNMQANTADKREQTRLRPITAETNTRILDANLGLKREGMAWDQNKFGQEMDWKKQSFSQERLDRQAADQAKIQAETAKKQASIHYTDEGYPKYGGYDSRGQMISALRSEIEAINKRIEASNADPTKPGVGFMEKQALQLRINYLMEAQRKIANGIPLAKDPWNMWQDPAKVKQGPNDPLLPGVGAGGNITLRGDVDTKGRLGR